MKKNTPYFSHDSNARNDEKMLAVRMKLGAEGYGIYFMILERLRDEADYMSVKDYNVLAFDFRVSADKVKSIINDFGLFSFTEDGTRFYSESLNERMSPLENLREQRVLAGKKSAEKRAKVNDRSTTVQRPFNDRCQKIQQSKEENSKEENSKENNTKEKFDFKKSIIELEVKEKIASDWLIVRKQKKAANTETAFNSIKNQIEISGLSANECIRIAAEKSWSGFRAEWLDNLQNSKKSTHPATNYKQEKIEEDERWGR